jgi:hypothetical protein
MSQDPARDPAVPRPEPARTSPPPGPGSAPAWTAPAYAPVGASPPPAPWVSPGGAVAARPDATVGPPPPGAGTGPWISPGGRAGALPPSADWREAVADGERGARTPLRPLGVGDILDGTFTTIRRNPRATLGLAAILVTIQQLLVVGLTLLTQGLPTGADLGPEDQVDVGELSAQVIGGVGGLAGTLLSAIVGFVLTGMLVVVVSEDVLGRQVTVGEVWRRVRPRIWALLVAATIAGLVPYVALAALALPGMILWAAWALTAPAVVLERLGPFRALRRSWRLVWPAIALVWLVRALSVLISWVIQLILVLPFGAAGALVSELVAKDHEAVVMLAAQSLGAIAADTVALPFLAGVLALMYLDRRFRGEGMDLVLRRQRRLSGAAPTELPPVPTVPGGRP